LGCAINYAATIGLHIAGRSTPFDDAPWVTKDHATPNDSPEWGTIGWVFVAQACHGDVEGKVESNGEVGGKRKRDERPPTQLDAAGPMDVPSLDAVSCGAETSILQSLLHLRHACNAVPASSPVLGQLQERRDELGLSWLCWALADLHSFQGEPAEALRITAGLLPEEDAAKHDGACLQRAAFRLRRGLWTIQAAAGEDTERGYHELRTLLKTLVSTPQSLSLPAHCSRVPLPMETPGRGYWVPITWAQVIFQATLPLIRRSTTHGLQAEIIVLGQIGWPRLRNFFREALARCGKELSRQVHDDVLAMVDNVEVIEELLAALRVSLAKEEEQAKTASKSEAVKAAIEVCRRRISSVGMGRDRPLAELVKAHLAAQK